MKRRILVPYNGSLHAQCALLEAAERASRDDAALTLLGIAVEPVAAPSLAPELREQAIEDAERATYALLVQARAEIDPELEVEVCVRRGRPAPVILAMAADGEHDLVVMGARSIGAFHSMRTGSVSRAVRRMSAVPVVLTPAVPWSDRLHPAVGPGGLTQACSSGAIVRPAPLSCSQ